MSPTEQRDSTKSKIQEIAMRLFAEKGFEATSVRDIANAAEVNVAAINYHFGNKAGLYEDLMESSYAVLSHQVELIGEEHAKDTEEFVVAIFKMFQEHSESLVNTFKVFLSQPKELEAVEEKVKMDGPPGHLTLESCVREELNGEVSDESLTWACKVLFSHLIHIILIKNSHCANRPHIKHLMSDEVIEADLRRLTNCVLRDLR